MIKYDMNLIEFTNNLENPRKTSTEQTFSLKGILDEYPYFQAAHFLYLNGLKNQGSFKYNNILKRTAAYTTDRAILFDFITSPDFNYVPPSKNFISEKKSEKIVESKEESSISDTLPIGKPIQFSTSETYSFNEWLQISSIKPIQRDENLNINIIDSNNTRKNQSKTSKRNFDLIDKFIASNPKINSANTFINSNITSDSITENDSLMTETLAHVYLEQKKYNKAITAFTVLSLKYPEKSSFFANQIEAIKKLQEK